MWAAQPGRGRFGQFAVLLAAGDGQDFGMTIPMQLEPRECWCETEARHVMHCGDCGAPARPVRRAGSERDRLIVVCLAVDRCGHLWRPA